MKRKNLVVHGNPGAHPRLAQLRTFCYRRGRMDAFKHLLATAENLNFVRHNIRPFLDAQGRYEVKLSREFPLHISLFHFHARQFTTGSTWHERLELFLPLDAPCPFRMGDQLLQLKPGDLLVVDNMQVHNVVDSPDLNTRVIVVSFLPELVYSLGSPLHDYAFLVPFYFRPEAQPHILSRRDPDSPLAFRALRLLLETYFQDNQEPYYRAGSKAYLLELLYHLARHFRSAEVHRSEFQRQQELARRFHKLYDHVAAHFAEKLSVKEAAQLCGLSSSAFMKLFKEVSGTTFVDYLTHVRLSKAHALLRETASTVAEIASHVGFADQSYFDRRFKEYFGQTPRELRRTLED